LLLLLSPYLTPKARRTATQRIPWAGDVKIKQIKNYSPKEPAKLESEKSPAAHFKEVDIEVKNKSVKRSSS